MLKDWKPPKQFLLGLGQPWEPDPWEYGDNPEDDELFMQASQVIEQQVQETSTDAIELFLDSCPSKTKGEAIEGEKDSHAVSTAKNKWEIDGFSNIR